MTTDPTPPDDSYPAHWTQWIRPAEPNPIAGVDAEDDPNSFPASWGYTTRSEKL
jgi:hypothetical protein